MKLTLVACAYPIFVKTASVIQSIERHKAIIVCEANCTTVSNIAAKKLFASNWKKGSIAELWDGGADRIVQKLIGLYGN